MGRVETANGDYQLVTFLIDPGSETSMIPLDILEKNMGKEAGKKVYCRTHHQQVVSTNWFEASFEFCVSIGDYDNDLVCYRFPGPVLAQLDKRHGIIGTDILRLFKIEALVFDWKKESAKLWRKQDQELSEEYLCHDD